MTIGLSQPTAFILSKARFQRNYNWDVALPDMGSIASWLNKVTAGVTEGVVGLAVSQLVQSVKFGDYNITTPVRMKVGPYEAHFAGLLTVDKVAMTFLKTVPDVVAPYFNCWKRLIIDESGLYQVKSNYQRNIYIRFIDSSGIAVGQYKLIGAFPTMFPSYNLNYSEDKVTELSVEFSVDKIEYSEF
jgi:hypothetical protein